MATIYSNYKAITLSGTMGTGQLGDGMSANTVHRVYCLGAGTISITPFEGPTFTWTGTVNEFIDVVVKNLVVNSGTFIGFAAKSNNPIRNGTSNPY